MKVKLNQYDELKKRFREKNEAKKPHTSKGHIAANEGKVRRTPKPKERGMYDEYGHFNASFLQNWLA
jgi:hypothetical protein